MRLVETCQKNKDARAAAYTGVAGFTLVEVLIATAILSVSIVTLSGAFKQLSVYRNKMTHYENVYLSTLSLRDRIVTEWPSPTLPSHGTINGLSYDYDVSISKRRSASLRGFEMPSERVESVLEVLLYTVQMNVDQRPFAYNFTRYARK